MLKMIAIGNLTNDLRLKISETTGKPHTTLRIACDRHYRDKDGNRITDFLSVRVRGRLAERCVRYAWKGCKLAVYGDFETVPASDKTVRNPDFFLTAYDVEILSPFRERPETAESATVSDTSEKENEGDAA